jgi:hypothetical protein
MKRWAAALRRDLRANWLLMFRVCSVVGLLTVLMVSTVLD